jgi:hypothetical protein
MIILLACDGAPKPFNINNYDSYIAIYLLNSFKLICIENIKNCKYIRVSTIELPQSNDFYYSLNSNKDNQNFILTINNQLFNIVVPTGSYNKQSIIR